MGFDYSKQWTSKNPGLLVFLVDQSYSMREPYAENESKARFTATVINRTIQETIHMNQDGEAVKNRLKIAVVGYGGKGGDSVEVMCNDFLETLADHPVGMRKTKQKIVDGDLRITEIDVDQPQFFEAKAKGSTAFGRALQTTRMLIEEFCSEHPDSPTPIVINVSDGSPWSNELKFKERELAIAEAKKIMDLPCTNGRPLIFNAHIGSGYPQCVCPASYAELTGKREQFLFDISSEVPEAFSKVARKFDLVLEEHARGFVSNASPDVFIKFINFGSSGAWVHDRMSAY